MWRRLVQCETDLSANFGVCRRSQHLDRLLLLGNVSPKYLGHDSSAVPQDKSDHNEILAGPGGVKLKPSQEGLDTKL